MSKFATISTVAALGFALAACGGSADRNEVVANDTLTANEVVAIDNNMMAADPNMIAATAPVTTPEFATAAAASDLFEIESSKLAQSRATRADVKEFAAMLVKDHTQSTADMKAIASKESITLSPPALRPDMQSKIDALKAATGEQFDTLYLSQQVAAHEETLTLHQGYAATGDNEALKGFAAKTATLVSKHLDQARNLSR
jgi:putative membrane protein